MGIKLEGQKPLGWAGPISDVLLSLEEMLYLGCREQMMDPSLIISGDVALS